jgi:hypothetical protein
MNSKVVYVKAKFKPTGKYETIKVLTGEKRKTLLGGETAVMRDEQKWVQTGFSDCDVDGGLLSQELQQAIDQLNKDGYNVISVAQVISGEYSWKMQGMGNGGAGYGYGFSFTEGMLVVAHKP